MLQIVETRLISVILWYHLAFFAISMAMLGMTAGSLLIYFKSELFSEDRLFENLVWIGVAFAIAVVLSTLSLITTISPSAVANTFLMTALVWLKLILTLLPPYVLVGMAISLALTRSPYPIGIVYGVDLLGAASGCLIVLALLSWADAISVLFSRCSYRGHRCGMLCDREVDVRRTWSSATRLPDARPGRQTGDLCSGIRPDRDR